MSSRMPAVSSAGANGCRLANSGQVIGSISVVALSFIVQEPSGIMLRSRAMSLSESERRYRSIAVSVRYRWKAGWVRYSEVRFSISTDDEEPASVSTPAAANAASTPATSSSVVVSSQAIATWSSSTRRRSIPRSRAASTTAAALPGTCASTVSKKRWCTIAEPSPSAICAARPWVRRAIAARPSGPW